MTTDKKVVQIFYLDDDPIEHKIIEQELKEQAVAAMHDFRLHCFSDPEVFMNQKEFFCVPDIVFIDVHFDGSDLKGYDLIQPVKKRWKEALILMRTGDENSASRALMDGADDFISKKESTLPLAKRLEILLQSKIPAQAQSLTAIPTYAGKTLHQIASRIPAVIQSAVRCVYVEGETGTGKEVVADLFEAQTRQPFIRVNCGAISEGLFESEFFGSIKGAYTGSHRTTDGLVKAADGGFLFLDEVSSLAQSCQVKLLRLIDNQEYRRVGDPNVRRSDVRVIAASNEPLSKLVERKLFRNDLFQRLCEVELFLPPLRQRRDEVKELINFFCKHLLEGGPYKITPATVAFLSQYSWRRGNTRELRNCLRAMTERQLDRVLTPMSIPTRFRELLLLDQKTTSRPSSSTTQLSLEFDPNKDKSFERMSMELLVGAIEAFFACGGTISLRQLEKKLGVTRAKISSQLKQSIQHGLVTPEQLVLWTGLRVH